MPGRVLSAVLLAARFQVAGSSEPDLPLAPVLVVVGLLGDPATFFEHCCYPGHRAEVGMGHRFCIGVGHDDPSLC